MTSSMNSTTQYTAENQGDLLEVLKDINGMIVAIK